MEMQHGGLIMNYYILINSPYTQYIFNISVLNKTNGILHIWTVLDIAVALYENNYNKNV